MKFVSSAIVLAVVLPVFGQPDTLPRIPGGQDLPPKQKYENKTSPRLVDPIILEHSKLVHFVTFSPDGRYVATATDSAILWERSSGKKLWERKLVNGAPVHEVVFSPDGRTLAAAGDWDVSLLDVKSGELIAILRHTEFGLVQGVSFSTDGDYLASVGRGGVMVWDTATRKLRHNFVDGGYGLALSPDGKLLVSASSARQTLSPGVPLLPDDTTVYVRDVTTGKKVKQIEFLGKDRMQTQRFSPDGKQLVCVLRECVRIYDVGTWELAATIVDPEGRPERPGIGFSPDGDLLLLVGSGWSPCQLMERASRTSIQIFGKRVHDFRFADYSADGRTIALAIHRLAVIQPLIPVGPATKPGRFDKEVIDGFWGDLAADNGATRYHAIWALAAKPTDALTLLKAQLGDGRTYPDIRVARNSIRVLELIDPEGSRQLLEGLAARARRDGARGRS